MRKVLIFLLAIFLLTAVHAVFAEDSEDMSAITVKKAQTSNGVVVIDVVKSNKPYELQCNDGVASCVALKAGKYQMKQLPKNWGTYDCRNVQIFPESSQDDDKKLGDYCLIEPK